MRLLTPRHDALWIEVEPLLPRQDLAHDATHVLRVYAQAARLAPEAGADPDLAGAAALVHDLVNIPKDSPDRPAGGERSAQASLTPLSRAGYDEREIAVIVEAVRTSSWSRGLAPTCPEGMVLQDADRLDAIGALGVARNVACAQVMAGAGSGGRLYHPDDPVARTDRALDDVRWAADHFRAKLLRLASGMHLPSARAEAARRHAFMLAFLDELERELGTAATRAPAGP